MTPFLNHPIVAATRLVAGCVALALMLSACSSPTSSGGGASIEPGDRIPTSDAGSRNATMSHVHGIARNPADGDVYVATHHGLWRVTDGDAPELVGGHLHDFMGFSIVGPDHFVASGHPNSVDELPPHLGLIESKDAGATWTSRSLLGEADFHALRVSGDTTYGWNSQTGELLTSADRRTWETLAEDVMVLDVVANPRGGEDVLVSVAKDQSTLELRRSSDAGRSFTPVDDSPQLARLAWPERGKVWGFAPDGVVWMSEDEGASWDRVGSVGAMPDAVAGVEGELLAAAGGKLLTSSDDGRSWTEFANYD